VVVQQDGVCGTGYYDMAPSTGTTTYAIMDCSGVPNEFEAEYAASNGYMRVDVLDSGSTAGNFTDQPLATAVEGYLSVNDGNGVHLSGSFAVSLEQITTDEEEQTTCAVSDYPPFPFSYENVSVGSEIVVSPSGSSATMTYTFHYLVDNSGSTFCRQQVVAEASVLSGVGVITDGSCNNCTGLFSVDPLTVVDVTNPLLDSSHCNYGPFPLGSGSGLDLVLGPDDGGLYGDLANLAVMDDSIQENLGIDWGSPSSWDPPIFSRAALETLAGDSGFEFVGTFLVQAGQDSVWPVDSFIWQTAATAGPQSDWHGMYGLGRPSQNPIESSVDNNYALLGDYMMFTFWNIWSGYMLP
jgi:hypothetical protein